MFSAPILPDPNAGVGSRNERLPTDMPLSQKRGFTHILIGKRLAWGVAMMEIPSALCPFPAVEYIPLRPMTLLNFPAAGSGPELRVYSDPRAAARENGVDRDLEGMLPVDRVLLACDHFQPVMAFYRGNLVTLVCEETPGQSCLSVLETGLFYKDYLSFEASLSSGRALASARWNVPDHIPIRRPAGTKGAKSQARRP